VPLPTGQELTGSVRRTYHIAVPADPVQPSVPVIVVFHGGGLWNDRVVECFAAWRTR
jgi:poly(3-hydroxybutyrate) depolymerase